MDISGVFERKLSSLLPDYQSCSQDRLRRLQHHYEAEPDHKSHIWKRRTLFALVRDETVFDIGFIPKDLTDKQIVHILRLKNENDQGPDTLSEHHYQNCKFLSTCKFPTQVFDLGKISLSESGTQIKLDPESFAAKGLRRFLLDPTSKGIALTFSDQCGRFSTYIWLKPEPLKVDRNVRFLRSLALTFTAVGFKAPEVDSKEDPPVQIEKKEASVEYLRTQRDRMMEAETEKKWIYWIRNYYLALCCDSVISISFYPTDRKELPLYYINKESELPKLACKPLIHDIAIPLNSSEVLTEDKLDEPELKKTVRQIYRNFSQDQTTARLALTFKDGFRPITSWYWSK